MHNNFICFVFVALTQICFCCSYLSLSLSSDTNLVDKVQIRTIWMLMRSWVWCFVCEQKGSMNFVSIVMFWLDNNKVAQWLGRWGSEGLSMFMSEQGDKAPTKNKKGCIFLWYLRELPEFGNGFWIWDYSIYMVAWLLCLNLGTFQMLG